MPASAPFVRSTTARIWRRYAGVAFAAAGADLLTKEIAVRLLRGHPAVALTDHLSFMLVWNTGAAGGVSLGPLTAQLNVLMTVLAIGLVISVVQSIAAIDRHAVLPLGLVSGGALGNLASLLVGPVGVADFLAVKMTHDTTIVANVADLMLWGGALLLAPTVLRLVSRLRVEQAARVTLMKPTR